jgi:heme/copper-type cytochrome/quinol oxidase subunit 3
MWIFLATDAMGFGGLFVAYGFLRARAQTWPDPRAHLAMGGAAAMTFALLASAFTVAEATRAITARARTLWLAATAALGLAFLGGEIAEYLRLWTAAAPVRLGDLYGATFYILTGYHGLHVAAGVAWLLAALAGRSARRTVEVGALYWQFVDLAWTPIFTFLYLVPPR